MQKYLPLLLASVLALSACSNSTSERPDPPANTSMMGEWLWLAQLGDDTEYSGYLSVSDDIADNNDVKNSQGGAWRWCETDLDTCSADVDGAGFMGDVYAGGAWQLTTSFTSDGNLAKLIALDDDNTIGTEIEGAQTFLGDGLWYNTASDTDEVSFGMVKLSSQAAITTQGTPVTVHGVQHVLSTAATDKAGSKEALEKALTELYNATK